MAFNKSKALEDAARLVSQRRLPQAIKQYQAILERDPQDLLLRNVIGDLLVRAGNVPDALRAFHELAETYAREGFTLKAIAIFKKIAKLDTASINPLLKLADLYAGQKLNHEASEQYVQALALSEKNALKEQAGQILGRLIALDPGNASYRLRLGELLHRSGQMEQSCQCLLAAVGIFLERGDIASASAALKRAEELDPQNAHVASWRARVTLASKPDAPAAVVAHPAPSLRPEPRTVAPARGPEPLESRGAVEKPATDAGPHGPASGNGELAPAPHGRAAEAGASSLDAAPIAAVPPPAEGAEVDFSAEWDAFSTAEAPPRFGAPAGPPVEVQRAALWEFQAPPANLRPASAAGRGADESQVEFYLQHGFLAEAGVAIGELARKNPDDPKIGEWQRQLADGANERERGPEIPPISVDAPAMETATLRDSGNEETRGMSEGPSFTGTVEAGPGAAAGERLGEVQPSAFLEILARDLTSVLGGEGEPAQREEDFVSGAALETHSQFDASLEELLTELDEGEEPASDSDSPDRHYNLGVAFQEMGLLDEAISEFQKAVKGLSEGDAAPRFLEATARLGNCFMEKRMPELAARWYVRALEAPGLEQEVILALNYDLGIAYEQSGNLKAAHEKFAEVYSVNIDYRDVSEKVQVLRSRRA